VASLLTFRTAARQKVQPAEVERVFTCRRGKQLLASFPRKEQFGQAFRYGLKPSGKPSACSWKTVAWPSTIIQLNAPATDWNRKKELAVCRGRPPAGNTRPPMTIIETAKLQNGLNPQALILAAHPRPHP